MKVYFCDSSYSCNQFLSSAIPPSHYYLYLFFAFCMVSFYFYVMSHLFNCRYSWYRSMVKLTLHIFKLFIDSSYSFFCQFTLSIFVQFTVDSLTKITLNWTYRNLKSHTFKFRNCYFPFAIRFLNQPAIFILHEQQTLLITSYSAMD